MTLGALGSLRGPMGAVVKRAVTSFANISFLRALHIIINPVITFLHGVYNYVPQKNRVSRVYSAAAVLFLKSVCYM